jgi:hypothetical protein
MKPGQSSFKKIKEDLGVAISVFYTKWLSSIEAQCSSEKKSAVSQVRNAFSRLGRL